MPIAGEDAKVFDVVMDQINVPAADNTHTSPPLLFAYIVSSASTAGDDMNASEDSRLHNRVPTLLRAYNMKSLHPNTITPVDSRAADESIKSGVVYDHDNAPAGVTA
jgi:hypothetical protein